MAWHRHQSSLEGIKTFSARQPLTPDQRARAEHHFYEVIDRFDGPDAVVRGGKRFSRPLLIRYTYEYLRSELSQDTFLRAFSDHLKLDIAEVSYIDFDNEDVSRQLDEGLVDFANFLVDNFFMPLMASGLQTPQPSPAPLSAVQRAHGAPHDFVGTPDRVSILRKTCLVRDHHRCVVSRRFDRHQLLNRLAQAGTNARDDEGNLLGGQLFGYLEVAHIIPHILTQTDASSELNESKKAALTILNMFDYDVSHVIDGVRIDRPHNAISLTRDIHVGFGNFQIFFEPISGCEHTYRVQSFEPMIFDDVPVTRTLILTDDRSIDPPSPRLLAIHSAIGHILHLSGAGNYINKIIRDMEETNIREDGSTELGRMMKLKLGWSDGAVNTYD